MAQSSQVEVGLNPTSKLVACPSPQKRFVEGSTPRRWEHRALGGAWRGHEKHQMLVLMWMPLEGQGHERWVGAEVLLMTFFPSLCPADIPSSIAPK
jgi:hypothetical protein